MAHDKHPDPKVWWFHRRKHSYIALTCAIVESVTLIAVEVWKPGTLGGMGAFIGWTYSSWTLVIGAYIAASTYEDVAKIRKELGHDR